MNLRKCQAINSKFNKPFRKVKRNRIKIDTANETRIIKEPILVYSSNLKK